MPSPLGKAFGVLRIAKQQLIALFSGEISCILYLVSHISYLLSQPLGVLLCFMAFPRRRWISFGASD